MDQFENNLANEGLAAAFIQPDDFIPLERDEEIDGLEEEFDENMDFDHELEIDIDFEEVDDLEDDMPEDEFYDEVNSEILETEKRNAEHLLLFKKAYTKLNLKLELLDIKRIWFRKFLKEMEMINDTIQQIEEYYFLD